MAKGALPEGDLGTTPTITLKRKTSASQKAEGSQNLGSSSSKNSSMKSAGPKPLMNPNALKIGKKKMRKGR